MDSVNHPGADPSFPGHPSHNAAMMQAHDSSLYTSSQASSSTSSLVDLSSERSSLSGGHGTSFSPRIPSMASTPGAGYRSDRSGPGPSSSSQGFSCPNCGKTFARDDLLRRHLAREARALAQPSFDRQKSCYECARSKARCDLEVPSCGRCRSRGKHCQYAPRSGNPNVRKARHSSIAQQMAGVGIHDTSAMAGSSAMGAGGVTGGFGDDGQSWNMHAGTPYGPATPGYVKREGEPDYDSTSESELGRSWSESYGDQIRLHRSLSNSSGSVSSSMGSPRRPFGLHGLPDSAPASMNQFDFSGNVPPAFAPPPRTESPNSYGDVSIGPSVGLTTIHGPSGSRSSGFSRTNTGSIVTNIDRQAPRFNNEEGEETPVVRVPNTFAQATSLDAPGTNNAAAVRQRTASLPQGQNATGLGDAEMSDAWNGRGMVPPSMVPPAARLVHQGPGGAQSLMPPPHPPSLITSNLNRSGSNMAFASPVRPALFTNGLDLSGWLEEPVVPSPLYRSGPGFNHTGPFSSISGMLQSPIVETPISARFAASLAQLMGSSSTQGDSNSNLGARATAPDAAAAAALAPASRVEPAADSAASQLQQTNTFAAQVQGLPTAKQCWTASEQSGDIKASLAQVSAACFVSFPSFLVLNDPAAPCPPNLHRRWLQEFRSTNLAFLANARSVLAGYFVRLPGSEGFVWKLIADQIKAIIVDSAGLCNTEACDMEVLSAVSALWMYLVLLIFTDDAACTQHVDADLLNSGLCALSDLSQSLATKLEPDSGDASSSTADFAAFSQSETVVRNLFAVYSLLVLQRFRENGDLLKSKLAGCELILDIPLPASAAEFEAASEAEWRTSRLQAAEALSKADCPATRPTLRNLLAARKAIETNGQAAAPERTPAWIDVYFDSQDAFANIVLSVALALDVDRN